MKTIFTVIALTFVAAGLASAAPANTECPVSGKPVKADQTVKHDGKEIGFCCAKCKAKFEADPSKFADKVK